MTQFLVRLVLVALLMTRGLVQPCRLDAQLAPSTPFGEALQRIVLSNRHAPQRWPQLSDVTADLRSVYTANGWTPLWTRDGQPTPAALNTIAQLNRIDTRGLNPSDYDVERLSELVRTFVAGTASSTEAAAVEFDVMLSTAALRSMRSLQYGRVSARIAHADLRFPHDPWDAPAALRALSTSSETDAAQQFAAAEPPYQHYRLLVSALARYRALADDTVQLRQLLRDSTRTRGSPESMGTLQRRLEARVLQITTTLERWRWLPHRFAVPPIIVNIPAFELYAFRSANEHDGLRMNVVVGKAYNHKTPVFSGAVQYLIFSPYWDVPPSIARKEVLPKARKNIDYLTRNAFEIVGSNEQVMTTTYAALDAVSAGRARIRQRPGAQNALGGVKFIFPNEFNVYMHDTPAQALFGEMRRDFSHGCIRLSQPAALAALLLRDQAGWDSTRIAAEMHRAAPLQVTLTSPVPVHVVYATAVARDDGSVTFHDDIYGHDRRLRDLLKGGYPYPAPDRRP